MFILDKIIVSPSNPDMGLLIFIPALSFQLQASV